MPARTSAALSNIRGLPLWAMTLLVLLTTGAWLAWSSYQNYLGELEHDYELLEVSARQRGTRIASAFRSIDLMLGGILQNLPDESRQSAEERSQFLARYLGQLPELRNLLVTDATGRVRATGNRKLVGFDASGREYFTAFRDHPDNGRHHVSHLFTTLSGIPAITLSRAIRDRQGRFAGVIVATIDPSLFDSILSFVVPSPDGQSLLIDRQGNVIYGVTNPATWQGKNLSGGIAFNEHFASGQATTRHLNQPKLRPNKSTSVFHDIPDTPLTVVVAHNYDNILTEWRSSLYTHIASFALIAAVTVFLSWLAARRQQSLVRARHFSERLIETANVMVVGLDIAGRVQIFNEAAEKVSGYRREEVMGKNWFELIVPSGRYPEVWEAFHKFQAACDYPHILENPIVTKDGRERIISWQNSMFAEQGTLLASVSFGIDVTERKKAEEEIRAAEEALRRLVEESPLPMLVSEGDDHRVTLLNCRFLETIGYTQEDIPDIAHWWSLAYPDPAYRRQIMDIWLRSVEQTDMVGGAVAPVEVRITCKDGQERTFYGYLTRVGGRSLVVFVDLTERRRTEARLAEALVLNKAIVDESPVGIVLYRGDGPCVAVNPAFATLIGGSVAEVAKQNFRRLESWRRTGLLDAALDVLDNNVAASKEVHITSSFGREVWLDCKLAPVTLDGVKHLLGLATDISGFRASEEALREVTRLAEQANRSKSEFLANMSHEIRTPMNAVIGLSQLALGEAREPRLRDYLQKIFSSASALLDILNDVLDYSKIEAGRLKIEETDFSPAEVVGNTLSLLATSAERKGIAIESEIADDVPVRLTGDPLRLGQVLTNLAGNAVKFTERGGVRIAVRALGAPAGKVRLAFMVEDTGIGMTAEQQRDIFQPFVQADGSITRRFGGSGLGLTISRRLLQLMGSDIDVESRIGEGSRFSFELELGLAQPPAQPQPKPQHAAQLAALAAPIAGARILLVEDNAVNQQVARSFLERAGLAVKVATHGGEALALLAREDFDAVLMDLQMPVMDGFEATRRIRADGRHGSLPVVALTASAMARDRDECLAAGMNEHLAKPINPQRLIETLLRVMPARAAAEPPADDAAASPAAALCELDAQLRNHEFVPAESLAALHAHLDGGKAAGTLALLEQAISNYDYARARRLLADVARALDVSLEQAL